MPEDIAYVNNINKAKAALKYINWNFYEKTPFSPDEVRPFNPRSHHWYPATFIPEIPFALIEALTPQGAIVWDPFSGIGTTYFQALTLNRYAKATEICTVAFEYMKSMFQLFNPQIDLFKIQKAAEQKIEHFDPSKNYSREVPNDVLVDKLAPWFSAKTANELFFLLTESARTEKETKAIFTICLSALLRSVSSQDRGWGCVADNVLPKEGKNKIEDKNVIGLFKSSSRRLSKDISQHLKNLGDAYPLTYKVMSEKQTIFHEDVRNCKSIPDNSVDLIVTSPPYPNMTDYVTAQRLSYYLLGFDLIKKDKLDDGASEIGARARRRTKDSVERYCEDMRKANESISGKLKKEGYACYVLPAFNVDNDNNKKRRQAVQKVLAGMTDFSLIKEEEYERILPQKRRSHNKSWATLERERIYLFRKV